MKEPQMNFKQELEQLITKSIRVTAKRLEINFMQGKYPCILLNTEWGYDPDLGLLHVPCNYAEQASGVTLAVAKEISPMCSKCSIKPPKKVQTKLKFITTKND